MRHPGRIEDINIIKIISTLVLFLIGIIALAEASPTNNPNGPIPLEETTLSTLEKQAAFCKG